MAQWVRRLPDIATILTVRRGVGCCAGCGRRVQGRDAEQSSDALGAAASQVGPRAAGPGSGAAQEFCGMPLGKICRPGFSPFHLARDRAGYPRPWTAMATKSFATTRR